MTSPRPSTADKRKTYRALHETGCFVLPNPWDIGSARYLQHVGFKALASTSAGYAFAQGLPDSAVDRDMMLAHLRELAAETDVPVNADFEGGYADDPDEVAANVRLCIDTGVAGLSIEDATMDEAIPLYDFDLALARVRAARAAIDKSNSGVLFTARTEGFIRNRPDIDETVRRLKAFADAGADCLYAPGVRSREHIEAVIKAVAPKSVNILMPANLGFSVSDLERMGARRISVGGSLARIAWTAVARAAQEMLAQGTFTCFDGTMTNAELNALFRADMTKRGRS
jgi:2-methylisocitrate lyase-like PEP mutase family enzyme